MQNVKEDFAQDSQENTKFGHEPLPALFSCCPFFRDHSELTKIGLEKFLKDTL